MMKKTFTKLISYALSGALAMSSLIVPQVNVGAEEVSETVPETVTLSEYSEPETELTTTFCADDLTKTTTTTTTAATETTTTTAPQDRYLSYTFSIVDKDTGKLVPNVDVKFFKIVDSRGSVAAIRDGNYTVIDEWNTGDGVAHNVAEFNAGVIVDGEYYGIYIEQLPANYFNEYTSEKSVIRGSYGKDESGHYSESIAVRYADETGYPIEGTWSADLQAVDRKTKQPITGVNMRVEDPDTGEVIAEWITGDESYYVDGLKYTFDTPVDVLSSKEYVAYFSNFPEGYYTDNYGQGENGEVYCTFSFAKKFYEAQENEYMNLTFDFENINNPIETITTTAESYISTTTTVVTTTAGVKYFASIDEMVEMAKKDYQSKTGVYPTNSEAVILEDGSLSIAMYDDSGARLETYVVDPTTGNGIAQSGDVVDLPQTGMSGAHKAIAGLAALMTLTGVALVKKSKKEDED